MATYNNQHWLLTHIRNSFISTDDTGMCEAVMLSDDLSNHFLRKEKIRRSTRNINNFTPCLESDIEHLSYPGLEQSDDEDMELTSQSFDIQTYAEMGAHRYRSMTAQKLEKMDLARRKAARIKSIKFDDYAPEDKECIFVRKNVLCQSFENMKMSVLTNALVNCPKPVQNKFLQYARFDGSSQTGIPTKILNIFLTMLPENQKNYPIKICVLATAKIIEVIGFICYKCSILNSEVPLQSVRNYGLYITEEDGEIDLDFPPLDLREPCSKFGFTHLALAERRPSAHVTRIDYRSLSMTSETEAIGETAVADAHSIGNSHSDGDMAKMLGHNLMIEAPMYRTFRVNVLGKGFFKTEVQLGISGERIEIDPVQQKNSKFWTRQKAISYNIENIAYCELLDQKNHKSIIRIWYLNLQPTGSSSMSFYPELPYAQSNVLPQSFANTSSTSGAQSPQHFNSITNLNNFKHYNFETDTRTAEQIYNKVNFILDVRSSVSRREFLIAKERKRDKNFKKGLLPFAK